ncbi:hypothetical protein D3C76_1688220 [compost metagenome]
MTSQQIKEYFLDVVWVKLQMTNNFISEFLCTDFAFCYKINDSFRKWIVHDCIKLVSLQPRHRIIPHLSYDVEIILD